MKNPFILFWAALIFASIAWYAFLVVYLGLKAGREIRDMIKILGRPPGDPPPPER